MWDELIFINLSVIIGQLSKKRCHWFKFGEEGYLPKPLIMTSNVHRWRTLVNSLSEWGSLDRNLLPLLFSFNLPFVAKISQSGRVESGNPYRGYVISAQTTMYAESHFTRPSNADYVTRLSFLVWLSDHMRSVESLSPSQERNEFSV